MKYEIYLELKCLIFLPTIYIFFDKLIYYILEHSHNCLSKIIYLSNIKLNRNTKITNISMYNQSEKL